MSIYARPVIGETTEEYTPKRHIAAEMTDRELKNKICKDVQGGCAECGVLDHCQYGREYIRRSKK